MKKNLMFILIFSLGLFVFCPSVFATSNIAMTDEIAQKMFDYFLTDGNICVAMNSPNNVTSENITNAKNMISNTDISSFVTNFNNRFDSVISDYFSDCNVTWENIFCIAQINTSNGIIFNFYIQNIKNNELISLYNSSDKYSISNSNSNTYRFYVSCDIWHNGIYYDTGSSNSNSMAYFYYNSVVNSEPTLNGNTIDFPFLYTFTENQKINYSSDGVNFNEYTLKYHNSSNDSESGDNGTYYNYDYNEYFIRPYIKIETINGLTQYLADSYTIPFSVYSQSGDEYYPFDSLKMDLRVLKSVTDYSGDNLETHFVSMVDSYKRYSGNFADTTGYSDFVTNGNILRYNYDLKDKFDSNFVNQYLNDATNKEQYAFQLVLYDFWGDVLSMSDVFYFYNANNLNNKPLIDNWGGDSSINSSFDSANTADFSSLVKTFTDFMSTIMSFWSFLPGWLIALLTLGVTSAIAIRILGR